MKSEKISFDVKKTARTSSPISFNLLKKVKEEILGKNYYLSLVFVGEKLSQKINKEYRKKNKPANILSFSLEKNSGEIFIDSNTAKKEAEKAGLNYKKFALRLFIHACLHLKGYSHSSRMNKEEDKFLAKFSS